MSLRIYLDDCISAKRLAALLRNAGHAVTTPAEAGIKGMRDDVHFQYARSKDDVVLTTNPDDFAALHASTPEHPGILAIYQDNDPRRDMNYAEIVKAIGNLEAAGVAISNCFHVLNAWRY